MKFFELGKVRQIVEESLGLEVTYFYEDLVMVEHSPFIIRFDQEETDLFHVYFNQDCAEPDRATLFSRLSDSAARNGLRCVRTGSFRQNPVAGKEAMELQFYEPAG